MSNYSSLKATINANIKTNGNEEITGQILNSVLTDMVNSLGAGYQYMGVATPSTNPGTPDNKVFYFATQAGTYTNFGGLVLADGQMAFLKWDSSWHKDAITKDIYLEDNDNADLDIKDDLGYVLARFAGGHIRTKYFNSENIFTGMEIVSNDAADIDIKDENNNILVRFAGGHIRTKYFNSEELGKTHWYGKMWMGFGTSITNISNEGKYPTYLSALSGLIFNNHGHSGGGITSFSDQSIYNDIMSANFTGYDLITLEVGANDGSAPLGTIYDGLSGSPVQDNSTFCGALNKCIRHLQANSNAQVVVMCSPAGRYQRSNPSNVYDGDETSGSDNHTTIERNLAIQQVCMLNSCWFIPAGAMDGFGYARMNASNDYNTDNVHHTNLGGYNFAQAIWAFLKNIPLFYQSIS